MVKKKSEKGKPKKARSLSAKQEAILTVLYGHPEGIYNLHVLDRIQAADEDMGRKPMSLGTFYPTTKRLEAEGFLEGFDGEEVSPGIRRRYLKITGLGERTLIADRQYREYLVKRSSGSRQLPAPAPVSGLTVDRLTGGAS